MMTRAVWCAEGVTDELEVEVVFRKGTVFLCCCVIQRNTDEQPNCLRNTNFVTKT